MSQTTAFQSTADSLAESLAAPLNDAELSSSHIDRILNTARDHLGMEIAFISRYVEGDEREFTHISTDLPVPHKPGFREPKEESFCFHVLEGRLPGLIHDASDHPLAQTLPITNALPVGCHLNVPMRFSDGQIYGSFCALSRSPDRSITERDMGVLSAFASLAIESIERDQGDDLRLARSRERVSSVIADRALDIVHQPIFDLQSRKPVGVECLSRFPDRGQRGPDAWFADAEDVGLGIDLEMLAVEQALATLDAVPPGMYATVNVSPQAVLSGRLHPLLPVDCRERLVIEVTEHAQVPDYDELKRALLSLQRNVRIAIDDVGAGYAGLRHIVDLSPDILKLDMTLTRDIHLDAARDALTGAMVRLAAKIGATLVAEGIETAEEADCLTKLGAGFGQGYFFARPMPVGEARELMLEAGSA